MPLTFDQDNRVVFFRYQGCICIRYMSKWSYIMDMETYNTHVWGSMREIHKDSWQNLSRVRDPEHDFSERYDIGVLDETTVKLFLEKSKEYDVTAEDLRAELKELLGLSTSWWDIDYILPRLFMDFDRRELTVLTKHFDDGVRFDNYAPKHWTSEFHDFWDEELPVPELFKYWVIDGVDTRTLMSFD